MSDETADLPDGWFLQHGQPEPTPEEIARAAAEIRGEWNQRRWANSQGMTVEEMTGDHWEPPVAKAPDFIRRLPE